MIEYSPFLVGYTDFIGDYMIEVPMVSTIVIQKDTPPPITMNIRYSSSHGSPFSFNFENSLQEILANFIRSGCVWVGPTGNLSPLSSFVVAGGYFRNNIDKSNKRYLPSLDDSESDIDIYLLGRTEEIVLYDTPDFAVRDMNQLKFHVGDDKLGDGVELIFTTVKLIGIDGQKIQLIDTKTKLSDENILLAPTKIVDIINNFDFICCMAGAEYHVGYANTSTNSQLAEVSLLDHLQHPKFLESAFTKKLLLNSQCKLPLSLERYTKYVSNYGYLPNKNNMAALKRLMGIPEGFRLSYDNV